LKDYEVVGDMTLEAVRNIQTPTLLVYGRDSHFISSYDFLHQALPNCKPVLLPGGEHFGPLEQPELLTEHIQQFLKRPAPVSSVPPVSFGDGPGMEAAL
jgi:pimeloyl-ACP methyl ester carboxylesterase